MIIAINNVEFELSVEGTFFEAPIKATKFQIKDKSDNSVFHIWREDGEWKSSDLRYDNSVIQRLGEEVCRV